MIRKCLLVLFLGIIDLRETAFEDTAYGSMIQANLPTRDGADSKERSILDVCPDKYLDAIDQLKEMTKEIELITIRVG